MNHIYKFPYEKNSMCVGILGGGGCPAPRLYPEPYPRGVPCQYLYFNLLHRGRQGWHGLCYSLASPWLVKQTISIFDYFIFVLAIEVES